MAEPKIKGGYIILSRKIIDSEIWSKPPLYLKVWIYLLCKAQYSKYKGLDKGYLYTSIPEIINECQWKVGYRTVKPTKDQIFQVLEWMRNASTKATTGATMKAPMIATTKATHGITVKIENYCFYQEPKNYESNNESNNASNNEKVTNPDNINKNVKKNKNEKNDKNNKPPISPFEKTLTDFKEMRQKKRKPMTDRAIELLINKLQKLAPDDEELQIALLEQSIENGWDSVYPLKINNTRAAPSKIDKAIELAKKLKAEEEGED